MKHILERIEAGDAGEKDLDLLGQVADSLEHAYCGFAPGAAMPVRGLLRHFRDEVREHLDGRGCPFRQRDAARPGLWTVLDRDALPETGGVDADGREG
jgi:NADH-quinone oxidoreductase subunit F